MAGPEFTPEEVARRLADYFPGQLGIEVTSIERDGASGRLVVEQRHLHPGGFVHGGVWASLADTVAAWATFPNLAEGANFSTAEMKVNLFGVAREGDVLEAVAVPLHVGRRTQVWEVRVTVDDRLSALYVCTQVIVEARRGGES
jgi:uncharacterized protein (TIGR00369 family)